MTQGETIAVDDLVRRATRAFRRRFARGPTLAAAAPGRVNLIGEHTDYNDGFVLPVAINRWIVAVADTVPGDETSVFLSLDAEGEYEVDLKKELIATEDQEAAWANYVLGVASEFCRHGIPLANLDLVAASSIPIGSGLSSSAALCVCTATMFEQATGISLNPSDKARWCQSAEHRFAGVPCGIMDQLISTSAVENHALLIDCRSQEAQPVPLPASDEVTLLILDTNVRHSLGDGAYGERRRECLKAVDRIRTVGGIDAESLRDIPAELVTDTALFDGSCCMRRARHVLTENVRVLDAVAALQAHDLHCLGELMFASHVSLRDDYEVSCPELDLIVAGAAELSGAALGDEFSVYGARMTGAGFGGCAIALCRPAAVDHVRRHLQARFFAHFGRELDAFTARAVGGAFAPGLS